MVNQGYKQTEIGLIPEDWEVKELNTLSKITRLAGYEYSTYWKEDRSGEIIGLRGFNIGKNKIIDREFSFISDSLSKKLNRSRLYKNDIIYPCVGTIGNACVITEDDKYHIQQNIAKITPNISLVYPYYLSHFLMSDFGLKEIERFNGSSSQPNVLVGSLRKYNIILPPLAEQEAIATALSDADAWIEHLEQLIAKKRLIKQGAMQELLTPPSEELVLSGVEAWDVKKLGEVAEIIIGLTYSPNDVSEYGTLVLRSSNIQNNKLAFNNNVFVNMKLPERVIVKENDLLVCVRNGSKQLIGKCALIDKKTAGQAFGAFMSIIRCDFGEYLYHYFQTNHIQNQIDENLGATINQLTNAVLKSFEIYIPKSLSEQERIATILSDMDAELEALVKQLDKAQQIKQGVMQELLTGRIRLV